MDNEKLHIFYRFHAYLNKSVQSHCIVSSKILSVKIFQHKKFKSTYSFDCLPPFRIPYLAPSSLGCIYN